MTKHWTPLFTIQTDHYLQLKDEIWLSIPSLY